MGIWSTYEAYSPQKLDNVIRGTGSSGKSLFVCELGKAHRALLPILTHHDDPVVGDIFSMALAGERHIHSDSNGLEDGQPFWWWDFYSGGGYNDVQRVKEIAAALATLDLETIVFQSEYHKYAYQYAEFYTNCLKSLNEFYQRAAKEKCAVWVNFG